MNIKGPGASEDAPGPCRFNKSLELRQLELHLLELGLLVAVDLLKDPVDLVCRGLHVGDPDVVVDEIDDHRGVFAHVRGLEPLPVRQLRGLVGEIGGDELVKIALFVSSVEYFEAVRALEHELYMMA